MTITIGRQVRALASTLAITALGLSLAAPATAADAASSRIGGEDRYETSALISMETFKTPVSTSPTSPAEWTTPMPSRVAPLQVRTRALRCSSPRPPPSPT